MNSVKNKMRTEIWDGECISIPNTKFFLVVKCNALHLKIKIKIKTKII